jgi:hypothetical protein
MPKWKVADEAKAAAEWARFHSWTEPALKRILAEPVPPSQAAQVAEVRANIADSQALVDELKAIGVPLLDLGELGNVDLLYPQAVPILLRHLEQKHREDVYSAILHALGKPYGPEVFSALNDLLHRNHATAEPPKFRLMWALAANATKKDLSILLEIAANQNYGWARWPIVLRIARWVDSDGVKVLRSYLREGDDPHTAIRALRLAKDWQSAEDLRAYLSADRADIRQEARKFFEALEKNRAKE